MRNLCAADASFCQPAETASRWLRPENRKIVWCPPCRIAWLCLSVSEGQLIQWRQIRFGVDLRTGQLKWKFDYLAYGGACIADRGEINCNSVLVKGNQILVSNGYDHGSVMLELQPSGKDVKVRWTNAELDPQHGGIVEYNGKIYGSNWINNNAGNWMCVDWNSG